MTFIYNSTEMQQMFHRYGNQLILLDATYKTTKYALPLFFLVVKTNVSFQVCRAIVVQDKSVEMITRALKKCVVKMWKPEIAPKYAFVDFDEREIYRCIYVTFTESKRGTDGSIKSIMEWQVWRIK